MPTTKRRHAITETAEITGALEVAARRWPEDREHPAMLLRRLIATGAEAIEPRVRVDMQERHDLVIELAGTFEGLFPAGYLGELRDEWPA